MGGSLIVFYIEVLSHKYLDLNSTHQWVDSPWHDEKADQEVGESQRHDQPVGRGLEALLQDDADDDQEVAQDGEHRKYGEGQERPVVLQDLQVGQDCRVVGTLHYWIV